MYKFYKKKQIAKKVIIRGINFPRTWLGPIPPSLTITPFPFSLSLRHSSLFSLPPPKNLGKWSGAERQPPTNSYVLQVGKSWLMMIFIPLLTLHLDKTWLDPLMGWIQQTSKVIGSRPKVWVEIDSFGDNDMLQLTITQTRCFKEE